MDITVSINGIEVVGERSLEKDLIAVGERSACADLQAVYIRRRENIPDGKQRDAGTGCILHLDTGIV